MVSFIKLIVKYMVQCIKRNKTKFILIQVSMYKITVIFEYLISNFMEQKMNLVTITIFCLVKVLKSKVKVQV